MVGGYVCKACDESLFGDGSRDKTGATEGGYRGCQDKTRTGKNCVNWYIWLSLAKGTSTDHDYCRNPDDDVTIWCLTGYGDDDWGYCDPKAVEWATGSHTIELVTYLNSTSNLSRNCFLVLSFDSS